MKLYKPTYKDKKTGKTKTCQCWYMTFVDTKMKRRRLPLFTNRAASQKVADRVEELLACCGTITPDLQKWFENLPEKLRNNLVSCGLIDNRRLSAHLGRPLSQHLEDFCSGLEADNRKEAYIQQVKSSISMILEGCGFEAWSDIDGNKVKMFLTKSRGDDGYGERTYNAHLRAFKEFSAWLIQEDRVSGSDPMKNHKLIKQTEFRKKRRALTTDEIQKLIEATEAAPKRYNMTGHERSLVYRLAIETGLRAGEIKSLTVLSFDFKHLGVRVEASNSKGKRSADLILMSETAKAIKALLDSKSLSDKAFGMPHKANTAAMLKEDLKAAKIPYTDDSGRDCDFHALRHTFITNLSRAGVHPTVAQKLARHSSIELTMKYYTHVLHESEVAAIDLLKNLSYACPKGARKWKKVD